MSVLNLLRKTGVAILVLLLVLDVQFLIMAEYVDKTALNPEFLIGELETHNFYGFVREIVLDRVIDEEQLGAYEAVGLGGVRKTVENAFSESWMKSQVDTLVMEYIAYMRSEKDELQLVVSVAEVKENILIADARLGALLESMPDEMELGEHMDTGFLERPRKGIGILLKYKMHAAGLMVLLAAGIVLLAPGIAQGVKRVGKALIGFVYLPILVFIGSRMTPELVSKIGAPPEISSSVVAPVVADFITPLAILSLYFVGAGIVIYVVGMLLARKEMGGEEGLRKGRPKKEISKAGKA